MSRSNWFTSKPCVCCGLQDETMVCLHHVLTRKAWPEFINEPWNHMPVCQRHHVMADAYGNTKFAARFPGVAEWFADNGWAIRNGKWVPLIWQ